jgi:hypothetical protein
MLSVVIYGVKFFFLISFSRSKGLFTRNLNNNDLIFSTYLLFFICFFSTSKSLIDGEKIIKHIEEILSWMV